MNRILLILLIFPFSVNAQRGAIEGIVTDVKGNQLPYATITVKNTRYGATSNAEGAFQLNIPYGNYTVVCQHVGYRTEEIAVRVGAEKQEIRFSLSLQELTLPEVVIRQGEDPAYEIIRKAIAKRSYYRDQLGAFRVEVYTKGQLRLRDYPKKIFGQPVDLETGDTSKNQLIYLSETISTYSRREPDDIKIDVHSSRVSGQSNEFGLAAPMILSFYDNNIQVSSQLNPRGFISPIADGALRFYRYKYEGAFYENGKEISRIRVIPKRKYEPLFSGYIQIVEDEWRIHSLQLELTKESQMQIIDTLRIEQLYAQVEDDIWFVKNQVLFPSVKMLGFDVHGSFLNVYSEVETNPGFTNKYFNNVILKYADSSNKKDSSFWQKMRPLPLQLEEIADYRKKDSLEIVRSSPEYLDSVDRERNRFKPVGMLLTGQTFDRSSRRETFFIPPLISMVGYNTVEGATINLNPRYTVQPDSANSRRQWYLSPTIRYGFGNHHLTASLQTGYRFGGTLASWIDLSGGKNVLQFNQRSGLTEFDETISVLFYGRNRRKIYEAWFGEISGGRSMGAGLQLRGGLRFEDRIPLQNRALYSFKDSADRQFTPNYPEKLDGPPFTPHQAFIVSLRLSWRAGTRYIEFPGNRISVGSKYPLLELEFHKGIKGLLGSDVDFDRWRFSISDGLNLKLAGRLNYKFSTGGFLNAKNVQVPDYFHLSGNLSQLATGYFGSFQLLPHYQFSNTYRWFHTGFLEHHFNGFGTNKIPLFRKLNWHLVAGANAFYQSKGLHYQEYFIGLENIFKIFRIDFVQGYLNGKGFNSGFRLGIAGFTN